MSTIYGYFYSGGIYFMLPALLILIVIIILVVKSFLNIKNDNSKNISLISSLGIFAFIWGLFGQILGLMQILDYIQQVGVTPVPTVLAGGIKVTMITTAFGSIIFLISRLAIIAFTWVQKETS